MKISLIGTTLPGTVISYASAGENAGEHFLDNIFYLSKGIMLSDIRQITGIDGTTLQNWVKRGWIGTTKNKRYSKNQLARILIIHMLRNTLQLETIDFLLKYINGTINDERDDIIPEADLYRYICRIVSHLDNGECLDIGEINPVISSDIADYREKMPGARDRLQNALQIIITAYFSSLVGHEACRLLDEIRRGKIPNESN